jgi:hypothetical protein
MKGIVPLLGEVIAKEKKKYTENCQKSFSPEPASQTQANLVHIILG